MHAREIPATVPTLQILPWADPVIDQVGYDPRSRYVERFWLGILGPLTRQLDLWHLHLHRTNVRPMAWLIHNERVDAYYHPDNLQGTYATLAGAHQFEDEDEAERVCAELNEVVAHGGALLMDDGWEVVAET
jgi:hypothetical protein